MSARAADPCPAVPWNVAEHVAIPRCSRTARQPVGSPMIAPSHEGWRSRKILHAAARSGLFVGAEEEREIARRLPGRDDEARRRALDVGGAEPDGAIALHDQPVRIGPPLRVGGHGVDVHVEEPPRRAAHGEEAQAPVAEILDRARERGAERLDQASEDPRDRWRAGVPGVEGDEPLEQREGLGEIAAHSVRIGLMREESVELCPKSLMKPSASATPQSADCA